MEVGWDVGGTGGFVLVGGAVTNGVADAMRTGLADGVEADEADEADGADGADEVALGAGGCGSGSRADRAGAEPSVEAAIEVGSERSPLSFAGPRVTA